MSVINAWVGALTPAGATVRSKVSSASTCRLAVSTSAALTSPTFFGPVTPANSIATLVATGLAANTQYWWAVEHGGVLDATFTGKFKTLPTAGSQASFTVAISSCAGTSASADLVSTGVSNRAVFDTIRNRSPQPLFFAHLGDMHYRNITANDVQLYRDAWDAVLAATKQHQLYRNLPLVYIPDDHDTGGNDSSGTTSPARPAWSQAYRERVPSYTLPGGSGDAGMYHSFEVGRILFVVSDTRHDRSDDALADGPSKTMLGAAQKTWLAGVLGSSTAKALVWLNPTPWMGLAGDTWAGFVHERDELRDLFVSTGWADRMVCISGDNHQLAIDSGGGNETMTGATWPVFTFGSMDSPSTGVSTQYDTGPSSPGIDRYGTLKVDDTGGAITLTGTGYIGATAWRSLALQIPVGGGQPATPPRAFTTAYDPLLSRVRLATSGLAIGADHVLVERSSNGTTYAPVRGGAARAVSSSSSSSGPLNLNPTFEVDANSWVLSSGDTIARSTVRAHSGAASGLITSDGSGASTTCSTTNATNPAAQAGVAYTASVWVYSVAGWPAGAQVALVWVNGADAVQATTFGPVVAIPAATWTQLTVTDSPPVGAVKVGLRTAQVGTPTAGNQMWIDDAQVTNAIVDNTARLDDYEFSPDVPNTYRVSVYSAAEVLLEQFDTITTPTLESVWLKSISRPFLNRPVTVVDYAPIARTARGGVFDIVGRSMPVAVTDVRGGRRYDLTVLTPDQAAADDFDAILASGDPVYVHTPAGSLVPRSMYAAIADTTQTRVGRLSAANTFTLPLTEIAAPGPDVVGATVACASVLVAFGTCQQLLDAVPDCQQLLELIGSPDEVLVP